MYTNPPMMLEGGGVASCGCGESRCQWPCSMKKMVGPARPMDPTKIWGELGI